MRGILRKDMRVLEIIVIGLNIGDEYTPMTTRTNDRDYFIVYRIKDSTTIRVQKDRGTGG
jgi:hypothetical protein